MKYKYLPRGSMQPIKKILGVILLVIGLSHVVNLTAVLDVIAPYKVLVGLIMAFAGYFLFISGRRMK